MSKFALPHQIRQFVKNLRPSVLAAAAPDTGAELRKATDRRRQRRFDDDTAVFILESSGAGSCGRLLDVSDQGARLRTENSLNRGQVVTCFVKAPVGSTRLLVQILWRYTTPRGFEYGARLLRHRRQSEDLAADLYIASRCVSSHTRQAAACQASA